MSLQQELHQAHKERRLRMASRAYVPTQEQHEPEVSLTPAEVADAIENGPTLVHETEGPLEPSNAPEPELTVVARPVPWLCEINECVRKFYRISDADFASNRRQAPLVFARHVAMYLAKELTTRSYPAIGFQMGGRDHTTIIHGVRRIQAQLHHDSRLNDELDLLVIKINEYAATRLARVHTPPYAGEA